jgi:3D-(3,5/4)-trihydroxycyclohexane-1,2-dione acylhydrolase (decyclizing)
MPGDLHKLWRTRDPKGYHVEYGYAGVPSYESWWDVPVAEVAASAAVARARADYDAARGAERSLL